MQAPIVVPCYNEADRLRRDVFLDFVEAHDDFRFLFVNDGSTDSTLDVLSLLEQKYPNRIEVLDLSRNSGKAEAVRQGMLAAIDGGADFAGYWDADLATPLDEIPVFHRILADSPATVLVIGSRVCLLGRNVERRLFRHLLGRAFASAASLILHLKVYDTQCGAKMFRIRL